MKGNNFADRLEKQQAKQEAKQRHQERNEKNISPEQAEVMSPGKARNMVDAVLLERENLKADRTK